MRTGAGSFPLTPTALFFAARRSFAYDPQKKRLHHKYLVHVGAGGRVLRGGLQRLEGRLIGLTKALAKELAPSGIRVNCIAPGVILTPMLKDFSAAELEALIRETPLGRLGAPRTWQT
jgi:hypothetical protein